MPEMLWKPSQGSIRQTRLTAFTDWLSQRTGRTFADYPALHQWSTEHLEDFWEAYLEFTGLIIQAPHTQVLSARVMPGAHWFAGMQLLGRPLSPASSRPMTPPKAPGCAVAPTASRNCAISWPAALAACRRRESGRVIA
jgi:hypothetical protein